MVAQPFKAGELSFLDHTDEFPDGSDGWCRPFVHHSFLHRGRSFVPSGFPRSPCSARIASFGKVCRSAADLRECHAAGVTRTEHGEAEETEQYWDELMEAQYEWSSIGKQPRHKGLVKC
jgi:hypothetical protein